jgi:hypothetical protein
MLPPADERSSMTSRRAFLATVTGGFFAWPLVAGSQSMAVPMIGLLSSLGSKTLGPTIPQSVLMQANQIIE